MKTWYTGGMYMNNQHIIYNVCTYRIYLKFTYMVWWEFEWIHKSIYNTGLLIYVLYRVTF